MSAIRRSSLALVLVLLASCQACSASQVSGARRTISIAAQLEADAWPLVVQWERAERQRILTLPSSIEERRALGAEAGRKADVALRALEVAAKTRREAVAAVDLAEAGSVPPGGELKPWLDKLLAAAGEVVQSAHELGLQLEAAK